jgi:hypothetical protein
MSDRNPPPAAPETVQVRPEIRTDEQVLAALISTGAGFESAGGSPLMLTEAVENGVDSIIAARKLGVPTRGRIQVIIDHDREEVQIHDDGLGFQSPRHIAEKPFESLKRGDPELTGKFARGIQGFRAFCDRLTFVTRRPEVPANEDMPHGILSGKTLRLRFEATRVLVELQVIPDRDFDKLTDSANGAVAIYSQWKKGEFSKLRCDLLLQRLQHHFGELVRLGNIRIKIIDGDTIQEVVPVDYSQYERIPFEPVAVTDPSGSTVIGQVIPELYLMDRRKRDRWLYPFLMHRNRPVGDSAIGELEEFTGSGCWMSPYVTGFVRCDFCQINELRLALRAGDERDALYREVANLEDRLEEILKDHSHDLFESRMQNEINELVIELQDFLRRKQVFSFKIARPTDPSAGPTEEIPVSSGTGISPDTISTTPGSLPVAITQASPAIPVLAKPGEGDAKAVPEDDLAGVPPKAGGEFNPFVPATQPGTEDPSGGIGIKAEHGGILGPSETGLSASPGEDSSRGKRRARRRRPHGFALVFHDDEFNDEMSIFDPSTSTVIINSGHPRYKAREGQELANVKALMDYLAELYIWEITKLSAKRAERTPEEIADLFLSTKFEFFEGRKAS